MANEKAFERQNMYQVFKPSDPMSIAVILATSATNRPEDLDAQLADLRAPLHHFRKKLNP